MKNKKILAFMACATLIFISGVIYLNSINFNKDDEITFIGEPPILRNIYPNPNTDGRIYIMWSGIENDSAYNIYRNVDGSDYILIAQQRCGAWYISQIFRDIILTSGEYGYKIKAIYPDGVSIFSNVEFVNVIIE